MTTVVAEDASPTILTFDTQIIGSGTRYQIVSGLLSRVLVTHGFAEDFCVGASVGAGSWQDTRPGPPAADAWFYMLRAVNDCGVGTYGGPLIDQPRPGNACPNGIVDSDFDGSPSDLDCNDTDPNVSPLKPEVCDGVDNNCDGNVDGIATSCGVGACARAGTCTAGVDSCTAGSPTSESCNNIDDDCDGTVDGFGTSCGVGACARTGTCAAGGNSCMPGSPTPETCNNLDDDCNGSVDNGFPNTDGDSMADCVDPDDDNDGALDTADCAPLNSGAFEVPMEVQDLDVLETTPTQITWTNQTLGSATQYETGTGVITATGQITFAAGSCLPTVSASPATDSGPAPLPGQIFYYLVKSRNACGPGTYGTPDRDTHPPCP